MQEAERRIFLKGRVISLAECGKTAKEISESLQCPVRTVQRYITNYRDLGEDALIDWRRFNFRKRKTSAEQDEAIVNELVRNPFEAASNVPVKLGLPVCSNTVRNRLREAGIHCRRQKRKVALMETRHEDRECDTLAETEEPNRTESCSSN